jgi:hypothetical protein
MWLNWPRGKRKCNWRLIIQGSNNKKSNAELRVVYLIVLACICVRIKSTVILSTTQCPPDDSIQGCPCYNFADGVFVECTASTEESLKNALTRILIQNKPNGQYINPFEKIFWLILYFVITYIILLDINHTKL